MWDLTVEILYPSAGKRTYTYTQGKDVPDLHDLIETSFHAYNAQPGSSTGRPQWRCKLA